MTQNNSLTNILALNSAISRNPDLLDLLPLITRLSKRICPQEFEDFDQCIQRTLNSSLFSYVSQKLHALTIKDLHNFSQDHLFPQNKIYFNPLQSDPGFCSSVLIFIPKGQEFSLHDHSHMIVFTKVLRGIVQVESMDIDRQKNTISEVLGITKRKKIFFRKNFGVNSMQKVFNIKNFKESILNQGDVDILTPSKSNIHRLVAKTNCVILDILLPDYDKECKYYEYVSNGSQMRGMLRRNQVAKEGPYLEDLTSVLYRN